MLRLDGDTDTDATGAGLTVSCALPDLPSLVAVIVVDPPATPVTRPLALIVALVPSDVDHAMARPARTLPAASSVVAVSCSELPTASAAAGGDTVTVATGTGCIAANSTV